MVCIYHLFWFTDWVTTVSPTAQSNAGWSQCIVISFILLSSIYNLLSQNIKQLRRIFLKRRLKKLLEKRALEAKLNPKTKTIEVKFRNPNFDRNAYLRSILHPRQIDRNAHVRNILQS